MLLLGDLTCVYTMMNKREVALFVHSTHEQLEHSGFSSNE